LIIVLMSLIGPSVFALDPLEQNWYASVKPPGTYYDGVLHLLGTDPNGRDVLSRVISGGRVSLLVGVLSMLVAGTLGVLAGMVSGYYGGWPDAVIMRLVDLQLAFPFILLAIFAAAAFGQNLPVLIFILAFNGWRVYARTVRGQVLSLKQREFIEAARCIGATGRQIIFRHFVPNLVMSIVVISTLQVASMIIAESSLSFLGFGVQPPIPSWGRMLGEGRHYINCAWWIGTFPGLAIATTVLGINLIGEGLRDLMIQR